MGNPFSTSQALLPKIIEYPRALCPINQHHRPLITICTLLADQQPPETLTTSLRNPNKNKLSTLYAYIHDQSPIYVQICGSLSLRRGGASPQPKLGFLHSGFWVGFMYNCWVGDGGDNGSHGSGFLDW